MKVKLSEVIQSLESGGRPKGGAMQDGGIGIPSLGAEHLDSNGGFNFKSVKYVPNDFFEKLNSGKIENENILIIKDGATTGKVSFVNENFPFEKSAVNEHVFVLKIDKSKALPKYIFQYLRTPQGQRNILRDFRGATVGGISRGFVDFVSFPLPSLSDQSQIANILSKAETLIEQRKQSIALLDEFLKSTFLEMFGTPTSNKKKFPKSKIRDVVSEVKYGTSKPAEEEGKYPYLRMNNITTDGYWDLSKLKYINMDDDEKERCIVRKGDLLFNRTNSKELVGKTAVFNLDEEMIIAGYLIRVRFNEKANPYFVWGYLNSLHGKQTLLGMCKSIVGMANINAQELQDIKIVIPPIELQTQFASIVTKTETLKTQYQQSLQELENLYGSLSQMAFKGELISSTVKQSAIPENKKGFAKQVLSGKIVSLFKDDKNFTHIKFQKLQYLAEHISEEDLLWNYYRQTAGPYDNKFMHNVANKLKQNKWFEERKYKFYPLQKANDIDRYYQNYFGSKQDKLSELFGLLKNATEKFCEAVSTIYAVWNNHIILNQSFDKSKIKTDFFEWSSRKENMFTEVEFEKALAWMQKHTIIPNGFGQLIKEKTSK